MEIGVPKEREKERKKTKGRTKVWARRARRFVIDSIRANAHTRNASLNPCATSPSRRDTRLTLRALANDQTSKPKVSSSKQTNSRICKVLYLFSGTHRQGSVAHWVRKLSKMPNCQVEITMIDIKVKPHWDLTKREVQRQLLNLFTTGDFFALILSPILTVEHHGRIEKVGQRPASMWHSQPFRNLISTGQVDTASINKILQRRI